MEKRILIGSIMAVVILVLVSFTGVVGYQTTKSSTIAKSSPLFSVRSSRAIDEESKDFTCNYVGKGAVSIISIPKRDGRISSFQKAQRFIDLISKMDDKTFDRFIVTVINHLYYDDKIWEEHISEIVNVLYLLRNNPDGIANRIIDRYTDQKLWSMYDTCFLCYSSSPYLCLTFKLPYILCLPFFIILLSTSIVLNFLLLLTVPPGLC